MSFAVKDVLNKNYNGSFKLQPQTCLTQPLQPIPIVMAETSSQSQVDDASTATTSMAIGTASSSNDEALGSISLVATSSIDADPQIPLSKKAIHQRDADENLFLRFLELDPPQPVVVHTSTTGSNTDLRRRSSQKKSSVPTVSTAPAYSSQGRTPFTITKKLTRTAEKGFGFSIVWTHPPRVEKVEPGLSADRNGIFPGDYVVFVGKQNVVTMPEMDVLNLIKSHGNTVALEIFRRTDSSSSTTTVGRRLSCIKPIITTASVVSNNEKSENAHKAAYKALNGTLTTSSTTKIEPIVEADIEMMADELPSNGRCMQEPSITMASTSATVTASANLTANKTNSVIPKAISTITTTIATTACTTASSAHMVDATVSTATCINELASTSTTQPRPSTACSNVSFSMESTKRRLHLPQVTFSKEVGHGVIV